MNPSTNPLILQFSQHFTGLPRKVRTSQERRLPRSSASAPSEVQAGNPVLNHPVYPVSLVDDFFLAQLFSWIKKHVLKNKMET